MLRSIVWLGLLLLGGAADADELVLFNGDRLSGAVVERTTGSIVLEHIALGRITVPLGVIRTATIEGVVFPVGQGAADRRSLPSPDPLPPESPDMVGPPAAPAESPPSPPESEPEAEWKTQLEIGFNGSAGVTESTRLRAAIRTSRTSPESTFRFDSAYRFGTDRGDRNENFFTAGVLIDWPQPESPWSTFLQGRVDMAEFQSWDQRLSAGLGIGYQLVDLKQEKADGTLADLFRLKLRGGAGLRKEFGSMNEDLDPEGIAGFELGWSINSRMRFDAGSTLFPSLGDFEQYRVVSSVDWTIDLNHFSGMKLKFGAAHEYDSQNDPMISPNDLSVYGTLVIDF